MKKGEYKWRPSLREEQGEGKKRGGSKVRGGGRGEQGEGRRERGGKTPFQVIPPLH